MTKIWKFVAILAIVLVALGAVLIVAGLVTGASLERMAGSIFGGIDEMKMLFDLFISELKKIF